MSISNSNSNAGTPTPQELDLQMQQVLELMTARAMGRASTAEVESAVQSVLVAAGAPPVSPVNYSKTKKVSRPDVGGADRSVGNNSTKGKQHKRLIKEDDEDYDGDGLLPQKQQKMSKVVEEEVDPTASNSGVVPPLDLSLYDDIPLGAQGAKMMMAFGDGRQPRPDTVKAALLGARRMLQAAIQDARYIRRKRKKTYTAARATVRAQKAKKPEHQNEWSAEMVYRAMSSHDRLAYDRKCGFDTEDLRELFPEEMNAYQRWSYMHEAYSASAKQGKTEGLKQAENKDGGEEQDDSDEKPTDPYEDGTVGHLRARAAQFDCRTDRMKDQWYLKFSEVRRGSFLPKHGKKNPNDNEWNEARKPGRGRKEDGIWTHRAAVDVRFLWWVGFDPQSSLPPPNNECTGALGFLGYDFFGKLVEKAIFLRNRSKQKESGEEVDESKIVVELEKGEQLEEADIARAMEAPEIKPIPLQSIESTSKRVPQLYFGPGFESIVEMELEAFEQKTMSAEDLDILKREQEIFAQISSPPKVNIIGSLLEDRYEEEAEAEEDQLSNGAFGAVLED